MNSNQHKSNTTSHKPLLLIFILATILVFLLIFANSIIGPTYSLINYYYFNTNSKEINSFQSDQDKNQVKRSSISHTWHLKLIQMAHSIQANRLLIQSQQTSNQIQKYILLLVIVFFVIVPATATFIFVGVCIYKKCTQTPDRLQPAAQINLEQYNIDELGPYLVNPTDNCSICLESQVNVRTYCGHFFHAYCLKAWYQKKAQQNRKPTCPVCVGETTNPVKIYCKKCFVSVKLDKLIYSSSQQSINQFDSLQCNQCKKHQNDVSFTQNSANNSSETDRENSRKNDFKDSHGPSIIKSNGLKNLKGQKTQKISDKIDEQMSSNVKIHVNHDI